MDPQQWFELYTGEMRGQGWADATYQKALHAWKQFRQFTDTDFAQLTADDVHAWHTWLVEKGLKKNSVNTHAAALRRFLRWLRARGILSFDPPLAPPADKPHRTTLSKDQARRLFDALATGRNGLRNRAIGLLLLATGLRVGELAALRTTDVSLSDGLLRVRHETSKTRQGRVVPLGQAAAQALREYLVFGRNGSPAPALFLAEDGAPLGRTGIRLLLKRAGRRAGVPIHPHLFRHTFATQTLLAGASLFHLKALLGHRSTRSTEIYLDMAQISEAARTRTTTPADQFLR